MVMRTMRENTKWIMLATAIAFVALMVFEWGMDASGRSGAQMSGGEAGRVNGESISFEVYNAAYRSLYDRQAQFTDGPIGTALNRQIEDAAWDQVVVQRLIAQELRRRGIVVTDDEVRQAARYEPPPELQGDPLFQTDGQFDLQRYHAYLSSPAVDPSLLLNLEAYYRDAIPRSKLLFQVTAGVYVSDDALWRMWRDARDQATVEYLAFEPEALVDDAAITITPEEIASYYRTHREGFVRPARASVRYVYLDRTPNAADSAAALDRARRLRSEIEGGADFAELARTESADSVSAADGGRLEIVRGQTVPAFEDAVFSLRVNELSQPVLSQYGYHLIRTERRSGDSATVRHILIPIELTLARENALLDRADSLDVLTETLNLADAAAAVGLQSAETELIAGLGFVPGIGLAEDGATWAFEDAEVGEISTLFETPNVFYAFELLSLDPERLLTQQEATETIRAALRAQKKKDRAREMARTAVDRIRAGESLAAAGAPHGVQPREAGPFARTDFVPGLGRANAAIGTAFGLRPGQTSGVVEAENTLFVIRVLSRQDADRAEWEAQKDQQRAQVLQTLAEQRWNRYLAALRENARVVDSRKALLEAAARQPASPF